MLCLGKLQKAATVMLETCETKYRAQTTSQCKSRDKNRYDVTKTGKALSCFGTRTPVTCLPSIAYEANTLTSHDSLSQALLIHTVTLSVQDLFDHYFVPFLLGA